MSEDLIERFVARVPSAARDRVRVLVARAPDYVVELRASVRAHVAECRSRAAEPGASVDVALAGAIGDVLDAMLALDADHDIPSRRIVTAAVAYFVEAGDDDPDFDTADGLVSDAEMVLAAAALLEPAVDATSVAAALHGRSTGA